MAFHNGIENLYGFPHKDQWEKKMSSISEFNEESQPEKKKSHCIVYDKTWSFCRYSSYCTYNEDLLL